VNSGQNGATMAAIVAGGYATCPKTGSAADVTAFYDGVLSFSGLEIPVFASGLMAATPEDEKGAWNACRVCGWRGSVGPVGGMVRWGARVCVQMFSTSFSPDLHARSDVLPRWPLVTVR